MNFNRTFFVTSVTHSRRTIFAVGQNAELFIRVLYGCRDERKFLLHAFVIMPEHFHLLITPADLISLEKCIQLVKGRFSFKLHSRFSVWQPSFTNHRIHDSDDYGRHISYIHRNPVKRGLVSREGDSPYSSANPQFRVDPVPQGLKPVFLT